MIEVQDAYTIDESIGQMPTVFNIVREFEMIDFKHTIISIEHVNFVFILD